MLYLYFIKWLEIFTKTIESYQVILSKVKAIQEILFSLIVELLNMTIFQTFYGTLCIGI